jgi:hypothetical protein
MSFDAQWADAKAAAQRRTVAHTELDGVAPVGGGDSAPGDLRVGQKDLAAVGNEAYALYGRLTTRGTTANEPTHTAGTTLGKDFALGSALPSLADTWQTQVDSLLSACALISDHLDYTRNAHAGEENYLVAEFTFDELNSGFRDAKGRS